MCSETPPGVVATLARQLHVEPFRSCFDYYCNGEGRWDHAAEIRKYGGFVEFSDPFAGFRLNRWLCSVLDRHRQTWHPVRPGHNVAHHA